MSDIDNIFIQVRARLHSQSIKLWEEPYYSDGVGAIESEMERLATEFSRDLGLSQSKCMCALNELQDSALRKLAARKEYAETGLATLSVRCIESGQGTTYMMEVKCSLSDLGSDLQGIIAQKLKLSDISHVKCISAGRIIAANRTLEAQGVKNNQQLMVIVGKAENEVDGCNRKTEAMYERIQKIKLDVEAIASSNRELIEMEDQDGNAVFMPPEENRAMLMGLSYCEKARVAMRQEQYDEALLLLLEADEKFSNCNSRFLESVDNYGLLNLDIVWCYLCLKNLSQLPDAERRLELCERTFRRSYGEKYDRLIALKGTACPERALIMRLHLLQGIILFHQNRRDEAYERLEMATTELQELHVDDLQLQTLVEMGFDLMDARLALRACAGNLDNAVQFIHERRENLRKTRERSDRERSMHRNLHRKDNSGKPWVNPRSVCSLVDMGYECDLAVEALRRSKNDVPLALTLLQTNASELRSSLPEHQPANDELLVLLQQLGFEESSARVALEAMENNIDAAVDFLLKLFRSEKELLEAMERMESLVNAAAESHPSTSSGLSFGSSESLMRSIMEKAKGEIDAYKAYQRFNEDLVQNETAYLDLPLIEEEKLLREYKRLLEQ